jgi:hypothetical protein
MKMESYRKWLVFIWAAGFLIPFFLILFQYVNGKYGGKFTEVVGWLTSLTVPTILLMIGVIVAKTNAQSANVSGAETPENLEHERFVFKLAAGVSILYLLIVNLVFFLEPYFSSKPQELMRDFKIFLAGLDSLISLLIGYFFGRK